MAKVCIHTSKIVSMLICTQYMQTHYWPRQSSRTYAAGMAHTDSTKVEHATSFASSSASYRQPEQLPCERRLSNYYRYHRPSLQYFAVSDVYRKGVGRCLCGEGEKGCLEITFVTQYIHSRKSVTKLSPRRESWDIMPVAYCTTLPVRVLVTTLVLIQ